MINRLKNIFNHYVHIRFKKIDSKSRIDSIDSISIISAQFL